MPYLPVVRSQVVEVDIWAWVGLAAEVADVCLASISPAHVGVHVRLAAPTAHRAHLPKINHLQAHTHTVCRFCQAVAASEVAQLASSATLAVGLRTVTSCYGRAAMNQMLDYAQLLRCT